MLSTAGFSFQFCDVAKLAIIEKYLAKFGYRTHVNLQTILRILLYFGYLLEPVLEIWRYFSPKIWQIKGSLFSQKSFVSVKIIFFRFRKCKNWSQKKPGPDSRLNVIQRDSSYV
jgi:hypothetical protein